MKLIMKVHPYYFMTGIYVIISLILGMILANGLVIFLGWNILLATSVFFISQIIDHYNHKGIRKVYLIMLLGIYILLFPNTIYVLTDFIHFQNYSFFISYPNTYALQIIDWLIYGHIVIGALLAAKIGIASLQNIKRNFQFNNIKFFYLGLSTLFIVSSLGIYIGRFLRFNSWNVFRVFDIIQEVFSQGIFLIYFILVFFVIHWVCYFVFTDYEKKT
ncbi:MAG: DUF1361 domain-containing protein [Tenericutes bacterium]|nr:DUF1361 domain-containing protein [Mycoplasmatota bacterium]